MKTTTKTLGWLSAGVLSAAVIGVAVPSMAQQGGDQQGQQRQQREGGQRGRFDPAQMRQQMMNRLKEQLGASDEEFKALQPSIEKVMELQRDLAPRGGMMMMGRGRGGPGGGEARPGGENRNAPTSAIGKAREDLRTTLDNKDASADQIKAKLDALRDAEKKTSDQLDQARAELKQLLTQRQEAVLVMDGMLK